MALLAWSRLAVAEVSVPGFELTEPERRLVDYARDQLDHLWRTRRAMGGLEDILACVLSDSGGFYAGTPLRPILRQAGFCAERHGIGNMVYREGPAARVAALIVAGPVPSPAEPVTTPCGICRAALHEYALPAAPILCSSYVLTQEGVTPFPQMRRFVVADLYPHPWEPAVWPEPS